MAQWITRLPTEQKIPGSSPGRFNIFLQTNSFKDSNLNIIIIMNVRI